MKKYWVRADGRTNVTYANNMGAWMVAHGWREVSKAEYQKAMDDILARWVKVD